MTQEKTIKESGKDLLNEGVNAAKSSARKVGKDLKKGAADRAESAKASLADKASVEAGRLDAAARQMTEGAPHTEAVKLAADRAHDAAAYVRKTDTSELVSDLADLARRHPVAAASLVAFTGFAVGRFLKSTGRTAEMDHSADLSLHHIPDPGDQATS